MYVETTPTAQPLDKLINKNWRGFFLGEYGGFILTVPVDEKSGLPLPPT